MQTAVAKSRKGAVQGAVKDVVKGVVQGALHTLATVNSNLCEPAVPCHEPSLNILVPAHEAKQSVLYRSIKQNHKIVKKLFLYYFDMQLFRTKTFLCRPNSQTQRFRNRSIKQTKKVLLPAQQTEQNNIKNPAISNVCFFRFGTMSFKLSQPVIPYNNSCLASKT